MVPMLVYALLGGARRMSISTTSLDHRGADGGGARGDGCAGHGRPGCNGNHPDPDGRIDLLVARLLRLGFLVEGVSEVVLIGLKIGVGLTIAASQLPRRVASRRRSSTPMPAPGPR
jgi:sulfate permease, SulP family